MVPHACLGTEIFVMFWEQHFWTQEIVDETMRPSALKKSVLVAFKSGKYLPFDIYIFVHACKHQRRHEKILDPPLHTYIHAFIHTYLHAYPPTYITKRISKDIPSYIHTNILS